MSGVDRDADGGGVDLQVGEAEDLTRLLAHLRLLRRVAVLADVPDQGQRVPDYGLRIGVFAPTLQRLYPAATGARNGLVSGNDYLLQTELAGERRERNNHLGSRAVGVGDQTIVPLQGVGVDLGDDERNFGVEPEIAAVVYDDRATRDCFLRELHGGAFLTFSAGEEGEVNALERLGFGHPNLEGLAR